MDLTTFCKSVEEQRAYLTETLGLTDADISAEVSRMVGVYAKHDVIEPNQEDFDAMITALESSRR